MNIYIRKMIKTDDDDDDDVVVVVVVFVDDDDDNASYSLRADWVAKASHCILFHGQRNLGCNSLKHHIILHYTLLH